MPTDQSRQPAGASSAWIFPEGLLKYRRPIIIGVHVLTFALSLLLAFLLANNMNFVGDREHPWIVRQFPLVALCVIIVKSVIFGSLGQYRGWWRYAGIFDLLSIARAALISTIVLVVMYFATMYTRLSDMVPEIRFIPQSVWLLDMFATVLLLGGLRMAVRLYHEEFCADDSARLRRLIIIGAGDAGEALLREIHRMKKSMYEVLGFLDDNPAKHGMIIHGITVLGPISDLPKICEKTQVDEVAIAMPSATHKQLRRVIQLCEGVKVHFRTVPSVADIATGKYSISQIRAVDIADLLGREEVSLDLGVIEQFLKDKVILVTGAGGSIGSEMCRQVCRFGPKLLLLIEQAENALFFIDRELRQDFPGVAMEAIICDITDSARINAIFEKHRPDVVIHAAAHKHVPLMEANFGEAVKNNIVGTCVVADAADRYGAGSFVMISTDKAVNPTSIMGSSKRIAEMYIQDLNTTSSTRFVTVRFGNVLGSNGSVVPIFKAQIAAGGPVTVTHPEMRRYFMTIPEASQLVLQAASMGEGGEIFVLDMGEPVKIVDLARELITLSGFRPGEDIEIVFTGLRPGEKLFEELSIRGESMKPTRHPKIAVWQNVPMARERIRKGIQDLVAVANSGNRNLVVQHIRSLVPEYIGNNDKSPESQS
jgi:FlaA1/EpsC-like NDP-sugar epimerase